MNCGGRILDLSRPAIMGVINATPDSFSDGGTLYCHQQLDLDLCLARAAEMVAAGAAILDIGGESTRPGAAPVTEQEELDRVLPLISLIAREFEVVVSVDTSTPAVMREAASAGAGLLNDVRALTREGAIEAAAATGLPVCLMHMRGEPDTMQVDPDYGDVVQDVVQYLQRRVDVCTAAGIAHDRLLVDPGFGFGKTLEHNLQLLDGLAALVELGAPILVGLSRKSLIDKLLGRSIEERLPASLALAVLAVERGATIIRTHDVAATVDAVAMSSALKDMRDL